MWAGRWSGILQMAIGRFAPAHFAEIAFTEDQFHSPERLLGVVRAGLRGTRCEDVAAVIERVVLSAHSSLAA